MNLAKMYEDEVAYYLQQIRDFTEWELTERQANLVQRLASRLTNSAINLGQERVKGGHKK